MKILKASGEEEIFSRDKFCNSLRVAGAKDNITTEICDIIEGGLKPGMTSTDLFRNASFHLLKNNPKVAARYSLKRGINELGPAGFLFEQYVEVMLKAMGYNTLRNQIIQGDCVEHEVDVIAKDGSNHILIEAKYHNKRGTKSHIDDVMYADARFMDITRQKEDKEGSLNIHEMWVITNTRFTTKAITYGKCRNLKMTGWSFPIGEILQDIVTKYYLYPITVLQSVDNDSREKFAKFNIILAQDIAPHTIDDLVKKFGIEKNKADMILKESHALLYKEDEI
jgi:hypothetical protein